MRSCLLLPVPFAPAAMFGVLAVSSPVSARPTDNDLGQQASGKGAGLNSTGFYGQAEANLSIFAQSDDSDAAGVFARTFAFGVRGGHRWDRIAAFATVEANFWRSPLLDGGTEIVMATDLGLGVEVLSAKGFLRTSVALGPSILTLPTAVDDGGEVGVFFDVRPLGLRWRLSEPLILGLDPLSFSLSMPVLTGIPLVEIEYRTALYLEHAF